MPEGFKRHPIFARMWKRMSANGESDEAIAHRTEMLAGLTGSVIEVGAGNGLNFPHYPSTVERLVAVEPEPILREAALKAARDAPVPIEVLDGVAERVPAEDDSFDAGVACLMLCTVDAQAALAELRRVIKPGGELRFYEHVVSESSRVAAAQGVADRAFWTHLAGGCHLTRDTAAEIERAGFEIETCRRFGFSPMPVVKLPHILGRARVPAASA
jgi:ubiquinone/menaquinone biosynthesis C-methylase UbiE